MREALLVAATFGTVAAGLAVVWASMSSRPSRAVALLDPDVRGLVRHEQARAEIETIERVTRQLMRATASGSTPSPGAAMPQVRRTTGGTPTFFGEFAAGPSFAWSPDPVASSSSSAGRVRFSASSTWKGS